MNRISRISTVVLTLVLLLASSIGVAQAHFGHGYMVNRDDSIVTINGFTSTGSLVTKNISPGASADTNHTFDVERVFIRPERQMTVEWYVPDSSGRMVFSHRNTYHNYTAGVSNIVVPNNYLARVTDYQYNIT